MPPRIKELLDALETDPNIHYIGGASGLKLATSIAQQNPLVRELAQVLCLHDLINGDAVDIVSARLWAWAQGKKPPAIEEHPFADQAFCVLVAVDAGCPRHLPRMFEALEGMKDPFWVSQFVWRWTTDPTRPGSPSAASPAP